MQAMQERYKNMQEAIARACGIAGRDQADVILIAVTKFVPVERILPALELGIIHVGENRAQEFRDKLDFFREHGCVPHFIGQLQLNKVKYVVGRAALIHSVDRQELAQEIERRAAHIGIVQDILVQVNIGDELQKGGIAEQDVPAFLETLQGMRHVRVQGLMCIPPAFSPEEVRPYFARMKELFIRCQEQTGMCMQHLSMGMSGDFETAIEEGATMVRVGTALFGSR